MQYRLRALLIILALGPMLVGNISCSSSKLPKPPPGFYDRFRVPFPPEIRRVLEESESFLLYSIEGEDDILPDVTEHSFHGFKILGRTMITDDEQRKLLIEALDEGISKVMHGPALCFAPRHGISVI